jgi:hypothetical protein
VRQLLVRDQREAEALLHDPRERLRSRRDHHGPADPDVPDREGSRDGRELELRAEEAHQAAPAQTARGRRYVPHAAGGRRSLAGVPEVHRVLPLPGRLASVLRNRDRKDGFVGPRLHDPPGAARDEPARHRGPHPRDQEGVRLRSLQHHALLHGRVPRAHQITDNGSSRSRSGWSIGTTIPSCSCGGSSPDRTREGAEKRPQSARSSGCENRTVGLPGTGRFNPPNEDCPQCEGPSKTFFLGPSSSMGSRRAGTSASTGIDGSCEGRKLRQLTRSSLGR